MHRLHALDAEFLYVEDSRSPMHIAGISIFEGPAPSRAEVLALYAARVSAYPRYRQRVRTLPLGLGAPAWVDDPHFELDYHVRFTALAAPYDDAALCTLMGRLMSQLLDRARPLWECWVVEGLAGGRWAMISKIHHSMVDGISGASLMSALLDTERRATAPEPVPWLPESEPSKRELAKGAWRDLRKDAGEWAQKLAGELRHPSQVAHSARDLTSGLVRLAERLRGQPTVSIQGLVGTERGYAHATVSLSDVQQVRAAFGGTVNDVALAVLSGAYRALMAARGDDVASGPIRSLVPVSTRGTVLPGASGNQLAALVCELPVDVADSVQRLRKVSAHMGELKTSHMADAAALVVALGDLLPSFLVSGLTHAVVRVMHRFPQRSFTTITTHVPGPRQPLYLLGREMLAYYPYVPILQGARVGTAILTYNGQMAFGITVDRDSVRDVAVLSRALETGMAELVARARGCVTVPSP